MTVRRRRAEDIAARMVLSLKRDGPAFLPDLLARIGYDPETVRKINDGFDRTLAPAIHIAVKDLVGNGHPVALTPSGRLHYTEGRIKLPAQDRVTRRSQPADLKRAHRGW